jgi:hypothetical protein
MSTARGPQQLDEIRKVARLQLEEARRHRAAAREMSARAGEALRRALARGGPPTDREARAETRRVSVRRAPPR